MVVPSLVGGVDTSKSLLDGKLDKTLCLVFLPCRSVKETGQVNAIDSQAPVYHRTHRSRSHLNRDRAR